MYIHQIGISAKKLFFFIALCIAFAACKDKSKFEIAGKFENATPKTKAYLYSIERNVENAIDSTVLSDKGEFKFVHDAPDVDFFKIRIDNSEYIVIAKNGDNIKLEADLTDMSGNYKLSGAEDADKLEELNKNKNKYLAKLATLEAQFQENLIRNPESRQEVINQMNPELISVKQELVNFILNFAMENTKSLASFYAINSLNPTDYETEILAYSDKIKSNFNKNQSVTAFLVRMAELKSVQVGQQAPEFTIPGLDGKPVTLDSYKGKYVMLEFWASWCQPCRIANPGLVSVYNTYKDKNFAILGISLDKDVEAWKQAIAQDGLKWEQAGELNDFQGATVRKYLVESIPASYLIDPTGKIVAKNISKDELDAYLNKTLR